MKKNHYTIQNLLQGFFVILLLFVFQNSYAQPQKEYYGCKHKHHLQQKAPPLTPEEIQNLTLSNERSDTIDILHYNINLDFTEFNQATISGFCEISIKTKMDNVNSITLDLLDLNIDSVETQGTMLNYTYDGNFITVTFPTPLGIDQEYDFSVHYSGQPTPAASGFGGLVFQGGIAYNLGIGLGSSPFNYGRGWFPCFDTFIERSTYEFNIISNNNKRAYCVGTFMGQDTLANGDVLRSYELNQEIPTYLAGIAVGNYETWNMTHTGAFGDVPLELIATSNTMNDVVNTFQYLDECVDICESWWGKYPWERVGYVMTGNGAMEHPTSVAYPVGITGEGPTPRNNELIMHELGHHWWGNLVTLNGAHNMWIKEGGAEYSTHLFYESLFGKEEFQRVVKENLLLVIEEAHIDDNGYQALSPMPNSETYGTHTYQKGALVYHNLRGYLGDSLYRVGTQSVLDVFQYSAISAEMYRDQLTAATGVDMGPFFDAWIFAPGYASYEIENMSATPQGNDFQVELTVQQKLHAATVLHQQVPLSVTCVDENYNFHYDQIMVSGEFTTNTLTVPFEPTMIFLNGEHELNLAMLGSHKMISDVGQTGILYGGMGVEVTEITDSAFLRMEEFRVAPDPSPINVYDARLSNNHFFKFSGVVKDDFEAKGRLVYDGTDPNKLDYDLTFITEDSLVLLYRPDQNSDWYEHPGYDINILGSSNDGLGFVDIEPLLLGEYTLANAVVPTTSTQNTLLDNSDWTVFPNPTSDLVSVKGELPENGNYQIAVFDMNGKVIRQKGIEIVDNLLDVTMQLQDLSNGVYVVKIKDKTGKVWGSQHVGVLR